MLTRLCAAAACAQLTPPSPQMSNGVHHQNGAAAAADDGAGSMDDGGGVGGASTAEYLGARQLINRGEYVRLLEQALHRLGFGDAARCLERDSVRARSLLPCDQGAVTAHRPPHAPSGVCR